MNNPVVINNLEYQINFAKSYIFIPLSLEIPPSSTCECSPNVMGATQVVTVSVVV